MTELLEQSRSDVIALCKRYGVSRLEAFGSAVNAARFNEQSDLDFLVEFLPKAVGGYVDAYFGLLDGLESLFHRPVDLVIPSAITNPYFRESVERTKALLYAA